MTTLQFEQAKLKSGRQKELINISYQHGKPMLASGTIEGENGIAIWTVRGVCYIGNNRKSEHDLILAP